MCLRVTLLADLQALVRNEKPATVTPNLTTATQSDRLNSSTRPHANHIQRPSQHMQITHVKTPAALLARQGWYYVINWRTPATWRALKAPGARRLHVARHEHGARAGGGHGGPYVALPGQGLG